MSRLNEWLREFVDCKLNRIWSNIAGLPIVKVGVV